MLAREACRIELRARTKSEALTELAGALASSVPGLRADQLYALLLERERLGTTAMGDGIAIPHARIESLDHLIAGFGLSRAGIDCESLDGKLTHLFFLLVAPGREGSAHLRLLAHLSRLLGEESFRERLARIESTDELFRVLEEAESGKANGHA